MSNISLDIWFTSNVNQNTYKQCECTSDFLIVCFVINLVHKILGKKKNHDFGMNVEMPSLRLCSTSAHKSKPHKSKITYIPRPWILLLKMRRECEALPIHQHGRGIPRVKLISNKRNKVLYIFRLTHSANLWVQTKYQAPCEVLGI